MLPRCCQSHANISTTFSIASRCVSSITCAYVFIVIDMLLCPRISLTTFGCTPWASRKLAQLCRKSWNRMSGSPGRRSTRLKDARRQLAWMKVPFLPGNTRLLFFQHAPAASCFNRICCRCSLSMSTSTVGSASFRTPEGVLLLLTFNVLFSKSMSSQVNLISSFWRKPRLSATRYNKLW